MRMKMKPFEAQIISGLYCWRNVGEANRNSASKSSEYVTRWIELDICQMARSPFRELNVFLPSEKVIVPRFTRMWT